MNESGPKKIEDSVTPDGIDIIQPKWTGAVDQGDGFFDIARTSAPELQIHSSGHFFSP